MKVEHHASIAVANIFILNVLNMMNVTLQLNIWLF